MKFKYLLRGLGIGIVVTSCIMGAYTRSAVANARVAVMKEYGFGEEATLVWDEITSTEEETTTETEPETIPVIVRDEQVESEIESVIESAKAAETETETETETLTEETSKDVIEGSAESEGESEASSEVSLEATSESEKVVPEYIEITVAGGDDSGKVSRKLYNAGIIDSASEYDAFLMQHGYDKKITVGVKTIYITDTWQDIAEKLTN